MSTKTTFKRIALVAVAALGFGLLSVIPSTAALQSGAGTVLYNYGPTDSPSKPAITISSNAGTNKAILVMKDEFFSTAAGDIDTMTVTAITNVRSSAGALNPTYPTWRTDFPNPVNASGSRLADTSRFTLTSIAAGVTSGEAILDFTPTFAGTYVFRITATSGWSYEWTVVAIAEDTTLNVAKSTSVLIAGNGAAPAVALTDDVVSVARTANVAAGSQSAYASVTANNAAGTILASQPALTATISGPGLVGIGTNRATLVPQGRAVTGLAANGLVGIFSDGTAGVATVTISSGSTVISTETVTFFGAAVSYKVGTTNPATVVSALGVGNTQTWNISTLDAAGVTVSTTPVFFAVSSDTSILAVTTAAGSVTATGVKAGSATFTICNTAACASPTITLGPIAVTVANKTADSATLTFDKPAGYQVGEAFTLTITAKDAAGVLADGTYANMATLAPSVLVYNTAGGFLTGLVSPIFTNGVATVKGFMPTSTGPVTFTLTLGANGTPGVAAAAAGAKLTATTTVSSLAIDAANAATDAAAEAIDAGNNAYDAANAATEAADAATAAAEQAGEDAVAAAEAAGEAAVLAAELAQEAAAEATDAANAATDAANAAAEAADAATAAAQDAADAVAALAVQVTAMINELKKQITALTNLVIKIQKKVKA